MIEDNCTKIAPSKYQISGSNSFTNSEVDYIIVIILLNYY